MYAYIHIYMYTGGVVVGFCINRIFIIYPILLFMFIRGPASPTPPIGKINETLRISFTTRMFTLPEKISEEVIEDIKVRPSLSCICDRFH